MKKDKILLNISSIEQVEKNAKLGLSNFLFPLKGYSIGYPSFTYEEIATTRYDAYVLVNRLFTDDDIDEFLKLDIPSNVKGFIVEDTGLYVELRDRGYILINFQNHLNNNYATINYWLKEFQSLVASTDITLEEIQEILAKADKPLVLNVVSYPMIMYSRRKLVSNFYRYHDLEEKHTADLEDEKKAISFKMVENEFGTACYSNRIFDMRKYLTDLPDDKVLFYLVNTFGLKDEEIESIINDMPIANAEDGFLFQKTVYRIGDLK